MDRGRLWQYLAAIVACLAAMSVGTNMSWTSAASKPLQNDKNAFHITSVEFSWVGAMLSIGAIFGAVPLGILSNVIGRKKVVMLLAPFMSIGFVILAYANSLWMLYLGRFLTGFVTGAYCVVASMYIGEIAENSIRGTLGSYFQLLMTVGILFDYILDASSVSLFAINWAGAAIPIVLLIGMYYFPDSPRWHVSKGNRADAAESLKFFRRVPNVEKELESIQENIDKQKAVQVPFLQAIASKVALKGLFLALSVMFFQQFSGINAVIFYSSDIFEAANTGLDPKLSTLIVGVCQTIATYVGSLLVDRLGRKPLLLASGLIMAISGAVLGLYFYLDQKTDVTHTVNLSWLPIICMIVFIVMFSIGYGPIPWLYMGEVFSDQIKESGMAIATVMNWLSVFIVTKFYSDLSEMVGNYSTFWIFSVISIIGCFFTFFLVLETKGKDPSVIQAELAGNHRANSGEEVGVQNSAYSVEQGNGNERF